MNEPFSASLFARLSQVEKNAFMYVVCHHPAAKVFWNATASWGSDYMRWREMLNDGEPTGVAIFTALQEELVRQRLGLPP